LFLSFLPSFLPSSSPFSPHSLIHSHTLYYCCEGSVHCTDLCLTTLYTHKRHSCSRRDSNPQSQ
jgi:hypothetical protein